MITPDKASRLREAAERATAGPWQNGIDDLQGIVALGAPDDGNVVCMPPDDCMELSMDRWPENAAYIAEADPQTVLALLAERERLRGALRGLLLATRHDTPIDVLHRAQEAARAALGGSHE